MRAKNRPSCVLYRCSPHVRRQPCACPVPPDRRNFGTPLPPHRRRYYYPRYSCSFPRSHLSRWLGRKGSCLIIIPTGTCSAISRTSARCFGARLLLSCIASRKSSSVLGPFRLRRRRRGTGKQPIACRDSVVTINCLGTVILRRDQEVVARRSRPDRETVSVHR
jgi:hypothetical protein